MTQARRVRAGVQVAGVLLMLGGFLFLGGIFIGGVAGVGWAAFGILGLTSGAMVLERDPRWRTIGIAYAAIGAVLGAVDAGVRGAQVWDVLLPIVGPAAVVAGLMVGKPEFVADGPRATSKDSWRRAGVTMAGVLLIAAGPVLGLMGSVALGFGEGNEGVLIGGIALMGFGLLGVLTGVKVLRRHVRWRIVGIAYSAAALALFVPLLLSGLGQGDDATIWGMLAVAVIPPALVIAFLWVGRSGFSSTRLRSIPSRPDLAAEGSLM